MNSTVTHLEAAIDGTRLPAGGVMTTHADRPVWVRYDLDAIAATRSRDDLATRPQSMWRYRELLPVAEDDIISLGETTSPLIHCEPLGRAVGTPHLYIKDESRLPTGSFKSRGMAMAVSMAKSLGITRVAVPTAGNAGGALAAYAAKARLECFIFMPRDTPEVNRYEAALHGAHVYLVDGLITDCGKIVAAGKDRMGWFDMSTLKEPYRLEGKKTMGLELAEQFDWQLPDAIFYPTGGGTGLIGMWKAFDELEQLGWLESDARPKMFACQSTGCCPIVRAFDAGDRFAEPFENAATLASGLRVPKAVGDFMILDAVRESHGHALAADESRIREWMHLGARTEGLAICPETAICIGALIDALERGLVGSDERIVIFNTGAMQKYTEAMRIDLPSIDDPDAIDWSRIG